MSKLFQVFVGCPFSKDIRSTYDRLKREIESQTPLSIVLADTVGVSSSDYLLEHITGLIKDSAACLFDVTGSNPNVSLEVGIAHTVPVDFLLMLKTRKLHGRGTKSRQSQAKEVRSIISDLQGRNRLEYKQYDSLQKQVLEHYLNNLPYMKRWRKFERENRVLAPLVIKLFDDMRTSGRSTKPRLTAILDGTGYNVTDTTTRLVGAKLLLVKRGREGGYFYSLK